MSETELTALRRIDNVVRKGRVMHIGPDQVVLEAGSIPDGDGQVYVDCSAAGLQMAPARPVFAPDLITLQPIRGCQPAFGAALAGYLEASRHDEAGKNRLCPPNPYPDAAGDWIAVTCIQLRSQDAWLQDPDLAAWVERSRLNATRGIRDHLAEPRMSSAVTRLLTNIKPAMAKLETFLAAAHTQAP